MQNSAKGHTPGKKDDILSKLGSLMPASRLKFWREIAVADVADLTVAAE